MNNNKIPSLGHNIKINIIVSYLLLYLIFPLPNEKNNQNNYDKVISLQ